MGNSTSSDESENEVNTQENVQPGPRTEPKNEGTDEKERTLVCNNDIQNSNNTAINVMRIGSYHQPVKITKIENNNLPEKVPIADKNAGPIRDGFKPETNLQGKILLKIQLEFIYIFCTDGIALRVFSQ